MARLLIFFIHFSPPPPRYFSTLIGIVVCSTRKYAAWRPSVLVSPKCVASDGHVEKEIYSPNQKLAHRCKCSVTCVMKLSPFGCRYLSRYGNRKWTPVKKPKKHPPKNPQNKTKFQKLFCVMQNCILFLSRHINKSSFFSHQIFGGQKYEYVLQIWNSRAVNIFAPGLFLLLALAGPQSLRAIPSWTRENPCVTLYLCWQEAGASELPPQPRQLDETPRERESLV